MPCPAGGSQQFSSGFGPGLRAGARAELLSVPDQTDSSRGGGSEMQRPAM